ncbi:hypothetical protein F5Y03DRAFT_389650 [Xylaria venustula]|nr:hypothetical protein F5Y03DRAFT_389650 [Xylaria venustula]
MAAAVALDVLGIVQGILNIVQTMLKFPYDQGEFTSQVRVTVGLDVQGGIDFSGDLPDVRLFNEVGEFLGAKFDPGLIHEGSFMDLKVDQKRSNQQPTYALFVGNKNPICISHVSIKWPSGEHYAWLADWGRKCNGSWYHSNVYAAPNHKSSCLWIGLDSMTRTGFQVHWPEFINDPKKPLPGDKAALEKKTNWFCRGAPTFKMYTHPDPKNIYCWNSTQEGNETAVSFGPPKPLPLAEPQPAPQKHKPKKNLRSIILQSLVIGKDEQQSAEGLCESATSFGPSFLDMHSRKYCRMSDKTLWPVCDAAKTKKDCFDKDKKRLVTDNIMTNEVPYINIIDWTLEPENA